MLKNILFNKYKFPKAFVFCLCLLILLQVAMLILNNSDNFENQELDRILHRNSKDVDYVILGDSRIRSNINEDFLMKKDHLKFLNIGIGGATSVPLYFMLKRLLNYNPGIKIRHCVLALTKWHLVDIYATRTRELYVTRVFTFREFLEVKEYLPDHLIKSYYLAKFIPSYTFPETIYFWNVYGKNDFYEYPGFEVSMRSYRNRGIFKEHLAFRDLSEINMKYTEKIIEFCINHDIHIQLLVSPEPQSLYEEFLRVNPHAFKEMDQFINHLCEKYQIELIPIPRVLPDNHFQDYSHLNRKGSIDYTELLLDKIIHNN